MVKKVSFNKIDMCLCNCHPIKKWVAALSLVVLGAAGIWWPLHFMTLLYWLLLLHGLLMIGRQLCKCC